MRRRFYRKPACAISIAFLQTFSDPNTLLATTKRRFRAFLKEQNYHHVAIFVAADGLGIDIEHAESLWIKLL